MLRDLRQFLRGGRTLTHLMVSPDPVEVGFATFSAATLVARRGEPARYVARIASCGDTSRQVKLLIDVYALRAPAGGNGHYAYFSRSLRLQPRAATTVEIDYDWARTVSFFSDGRSFTPQQFWRGAESLPQVYIVYALVLDPSDVELDRLMIAQHLQA